MQVEYHKWFSPNINHDMELKIYGHYGIPVLVFPCSHGRFFDFENFGMIHAIEHHINSGKVKPCLNVPNPNGKPESLSLTLLTVGVGTLV